MATRTLPRRPAPPKVGSKHAPRRAAGRRPKPKKRSLFRRLWWLWAPPLVLGAAAFGTLAFVYARLPVPREIPPSQTTFVYDRDGALVSRLHAEIDRTLIK